MISVFDYGAGNLRSVQNTLGAIGAEYELIRDAGGIRQATKLILPGVGHFGQMMRALDDLQVRDALIERIRAGVPFLGICLGLQALFESSEEAPDQRGLGIYPGEVKRFRGELRIPHMGWNQVQPCRPNTLLASPTYLYFAHSYYCPVIPETAAVCDYIVPYTAILEQANVRGVQFHPEKSGPAGLQIVKNFVESEA
ncbi:MAG: imidazole glycerol phosphate synthase subunit HisH [Acidobacteriia bacterium]|nr:imidazole glycerol phosphate synthase subunit HisH [Terriglobia bacterium]